MRRAIYCVFCVLYVVPGERAGAVEIEPAGNLSLFTQDQPIVFSVSGKQKHALHWEVFDVEGKSLRQGSVGQIECDVLELAPLRAGYYELQIRWAEENKFRRAFVVCPPQQGRRNPCFGVNFSHVTHVARKDPELARAMFPAARQLGFAWIRGAFTWEDVAPRADVLDWRIADAFVEHGRQNDLDVIGALFYTPMWASTAPASITGNRRTKYMPRSESFRAFCEAAAKRYRGRVTWWESWNEPDAELFWKGRPTSQTSDAILSDLAELSRLAHEGVRAGNPDAKILAFGATGGCPTGATYRPFLKTMLDKGAGQHFDALAVHYTADLEANRKLLGQYNAPTEIWVTEIGGGDGSGPLGHVRADITQTMRQWTRGAGRVAKFTFWPIGIDADMSLYRPDGTPRPAAAGWAIFNDLMRDAAPLGEVNLVRCADKGYVRAIAVKTPRGPLTVLWLEFARHATAALPLAGSEVTVMDALGRPVATQVRDHVVTFELGILPVYIRGQLSAPQSPPTYPRQVTRRLAIQTEPIAFAGFEGKVEDVVRQSAHGDGHWWSSSDTGKATRLLHYNLDDRAPGAGKRSLHVRVNSAGDWPCVEQILPVRRTQTLGEHETLVYRLRGKMKHKDVAGRGAFVEISYLDKTRQRIWPPSPSPYEIGTRPWHDVDTGWSPTRPGTAFVSVRCYLGQATGEAWFDKFALSSAIERRELAW